MSYPTEHAVASDVTRNRKKRHASPKLVLIIWILLISAGTAAAILYSNHLKTSMMNQLDAKWQIQTEIMRIDYTSQLADLSKELSVLQSKVETFNELLTFAKDNTSDKTDNSNKLYSQLNEVKKQLDKLQKDMGLLK